MEALLARYPERPTAAAYIYERRVERIASAACLGALVAPPFSRLLLSMRWLRTLKAHTAVPLLLPTRAWPGGAALGGVSGWFEDRTVRLAYEETVRQRRNVEVPLWTDRSLLPCVLFYANPLACRKCLDGEQKGTDVAMAVLRGDKWRAWPFFTVDLPEDEEGEGRGGGSSAVALALARKLARRFWDGNYDVNEDGEEEEEEQQQQQQEDEEEAVDDQWAGGR
jgi:hypothetical protein